LEHHALEGLRILVLEDEYLIALDVEQLCRENGASEVTIMRSLTDVGKTAPYDLAILDVMLSGNSTFAFARSLSERGVPFLFATGYANTDGMFAEFPAVTVVAKPYSGPALVEAIRDAARSRLASGGV
jgi:CheY-like chemotaxis protein